MDSVNNVPQMRKSFLVISSCFGFSGVNMPAVAVMNITLVDMYRY